MARCAICNYCRETDGGNREVTYSKIDKKDLCSVCLAVTSRNAYESFRDTASLELGEIPIFEDDDAELSVEGLDILEEFGVERDT